MSCTERKSTPRPKSFKNNTGEKFGNNIFWSNLTRSFVAILGMSAYNSSELNLLYNQTTPVWKRKCFLFSLISMSCTMTLLGLLAFFVADEIYNQGTCLCLT